MLLLNAWFLELIWQESMSLLTAPRSYPTCRKAFIKSCWQSEKRKYWIGRCRCSRKKNEGMKNAFSHRKSISILFDTYISGCQTFFARRTIDISQDKIINILITHSNNILFANRSKIALSVLLCYTLIESRLRKELST